MKTDYSPLLIFFDDVILFFFTQERKSLCTMRILSNFNRFGYTLAIVPLGNRFLPTEISNFLCLSDFPKIKLRWEQSWETIKASPRRGWWEGEREKEYFLLPITPRAPLDQALLVNIYRRLRDSWGRVRSGVVDADLLTLPGSGEVIKHSSIARAKRIMWGQDRWANVTLS